MTSGLDRRSFDGCKSSRQFPALFGTEAPNRVKDDLNLF